VATSDETLLLLLKTQGPLSAPELARRLDVTPQGMRRRLEALAAEGYVMPEPGSADIGRPPSRWRLAPAGEARFPDAHDAVAVELIEGIRATLGEAALDRVIALRERAQHGRYAMALAGQRGLAGKLRRLAELRSAEGYMAEVRDADDDSLLLIEHHCPICSAAKVCQGFCRSELAVFRAALGASVSVEREQHLLQGDQRCVYRVRRVEARNRKSSLSSETRRGSG
jgi:predicted ArsR family transcriptional regulator